MSVQGSNSRHQGRQLIGRIKSNLLPVRMLNLDCQHCNASAAADCTSVLALLLLRHREASTWGLLKSALHGTGTPAASFTQLQPSSATHCIHCDEQLQVIDDSHGHLQRLVKRLQVLQCRQRLHGWCRGVS